MSTLDMFAVGMLAVTAITGIFRGGISEIIESLGTIAAAILTYLYYPAIAGVFRLPTGGSLLELLGGFLIVFFGIAIVLSVLGGWLKRKLRPVRLGPFDRAIGCVLGFLKGAVIVTAIAWCLNWMGGEGKVLLDKSPITKAHLHIAETVWSTIFKPEEKPLNVV